MRLTRREGVLAGCAALLAVAVVALVVVYLVRGPADRPPPTANRAASPAPSPSAPSASASAAAPRTLKAGYLVQGRWKGGFNAELTVTNLSSQPVAGWTVHLELPDGVTVKDAWSADVTQVASVVTLRSQPWNTYLGPGGVVHFGFQATGTAANPRSCTVNGTPC